MSTAETPPSPTADETAKTVDAESADELPGPGIGGETLLRGESVGRFTVLDQLGVGGMGVVYAAYDVELERKVALKLLRVSPGRDASRGRARLLREAQAMAQLDHPNVVTVYEVGRHDGAVYIAMEFVDGETFGAWRRRVQPDWKAALDLLAQAARGLGAAHKRGLVHRDFKPDNVMVGKDGRVRVMDFGLVRAQSSGPEAPDEHSDTELSTAVDEDISLDETRAGATSKAALTQVGSLLGTPAYMPPEQFHRAPTDARSDQFSFCVCLWEALFDERPFKGDSLLVLQLHVTQGMRRPAPRGTSVPAWLVRVCERGLSTDPERRFPSMDALLDAVEAGRRSVRRRWFGLAAGVVVAGGLAVAAGTKAAAVSQMRACESTAAEFEATWNPQARARLTENFKRLGPIAAETLEAASAQLDDLARAWSDARVETCVRRRVEHTWSREMAERARWCLEARRLTVDATLNALGEGAEPAAILGSVPALAGLTSVETCLDEAALRATPVPAADQRAQGERLLTELATLDGLLATAQFEAARARADALGEPGDSEIWSPFGAAVALRRGRAQAGLGEYLQAEVTLEDAYVDAAAAKAPGTAHDAALELAFMISARRHEPERALIWTRLAGLHEGDLGEQPLRRARRLHRSASVHKDLHEYDLAEREGLEALELRRAELGAEHLQVARSLHNLGNLYQESSRFEEAAQHYARALKIREATLGAGHPDVAQTLSGMANNELARGELERGLALHRRALAMYEAAFGAEHALVGLALGNVAGAHVDLGQLDEALPIAERSAEVYTKVFGPLHAKTANAQNLIGVIHHWAGRVQEAKARYEKARLGLEAAKGLVHPEVANVVFNLALIAQVEDDHDRARDLFARALTVREAVYGENHVAVAASLTDFGIFEATQGNEAVARPMLERALAIQRELRPPGHAQTWNAVTNVAGLNEMVGKADESRALYKDVLERWAATLGDGDPKLAPVFVAQAKLELDQGLPEPAIEAARRAVALLQGPEASATTLAEAQFVLARAITGDEGRTEVAIALAHSALAAYKNSEAHAEMAAEVEAWLEAGR